MAKEADSQSPSESGGYGYNYGGYSAAGYGYGESSGGEAHRTLQDYLLILRERIWYIVVVFLVVFSSSLIYTLSETKLYTSSATVMLFRKNRGNGIAYQAST